MRSPQMAARIFSSLKQTQKAAEGPGPVCRLCRGRVGTWHKEQKQLASRKQRPEAAGDKRERRLEEKHGVSFSPRAELCAHFETSSSFPPRSSNLFIYYFFQKQFVSCLI